MSIIGERSEPHTYRTVGKNLRHIYIYIYMFFIGEQSEPHTYRTAEKNLRHIYIYIYIYIYTYVGSYVVHVPFTRALRANVGPAG